MTKGIKIMLFWTLAMPAMVTILRIFMDYILGNGIEMFSYTPVFLGIAAGGLIFGGPLMYLVEKSKENTSNL